MSSVDLNFLRSPQPITDQSLMRQASLKGVDLEIYASDLALHLLLNFSSSLVHKFSWRSKNLTTAFFNKEGFLRAVQEALCNAQPLESIPLVKRELQQMNAHGETSVARYLERAKIRALAASDDVCSFPHMFKGVINGYKDLDPYIKDQAKDLFRSIGNGYPNNTVELSRFYFKHTALFRNGEPVPWVILAREWAASNGKGSHLKQFEYALDLSNLIEPINPKDSITTDEPVDFQTYLINQTLEEFEAILDLPLPAIEKGNFLKDMENEQLRNELIFYFGHLRTLPGNRLVRTGSLAYKWILILVRLRGFDTNYCQNDKRPKEIAEWIISAPFNEPLPELEERKDRSMRIGANIQMAQEIKPLFEEEVFAKSAMKIVLGTIGIDPRLGLEQFAQITSNFPKRFCLFTPKALLDYIQEEKKRPPLTLIDTKEGRIKELLETASRLAEFLSYIKCKGTSEKFFPLSRKIYKIEDLDLVVDIVRKISAEGLEVDVVLDFLKGVVNRKITRAHLDIFSHFTFYAGALSQKNTIAYFLSDLPSFDETPSSEHLNRAIHFTEENGQRYKISPFESLLLFCWVSSMTPGEIEGKLAVIFQIEQFIGAPVEGDWFAAFICANVDVEEFSPSLVKIANLREELAMNHIGSDQLPKKLIDDFKLATNVFLMCPPRSSPKKGAVKVNRMQPSTREIVNMLYSAFLYGDSEFFTSMFHPQYASLNRGVLRPFSHGSSQERLVCAGWNLRNPFPVFEMELIRSSNLTGASLRIPLHLNKKFIESDPFCEYLTELISFYCEEVSPLPMRPLPPAELEEYQKEAEEFAQNFKLEYRRAIIEFAIGKPLSARVMSIDQAASQFNIYSAEEDHFSLVPNLRAVFDQDRRKAVSSLDCPEALSKQVDHQLGTFPIQILPLRGGEPKIYFVDWTYEERALKMQFKIETGPLIVHQVTYPEGMLTQKGVQRQLAGLKARYYHEWFKPNFEEKTDAKRATTPTPKFAKQGS